MWTDPLDVPVWAKIPVLVAFMLVEYLAIVPPTKAPNREDRSKFGKDDVLSTSADWLPYLGVGSFWVLHLLEIASIIHLSSPSARSSPLIALLPLSTTITRAAPPHIHTTPLFLVGAFLLLAGGTLRKACFVHLGRMFTFQLALVKEHKLVTSGPYAVVRHPSYTGFIMLVDGLALVHLAPGSYLAECGLLDAWWGRAAVGGACAAAAGLQAVVVGRTRREDEVLRREFGSTWEEWARRTRYRLVPYVY